jgi:hypothetical protein
MGAASRVAASRASSRERYLHIYLQDHYAGSTGGLRLAERAARNHASGALGAFFGDLAVEIDEDRQVLSRVMRRLGVPPSLVKNAVVAVGELVTRLKPDGRLIGASPLTPVVELEALTSGVCGKRALWQALSGIPDTRLREFDFETMIRRAEDQLDQLQERRREASASAFG